MQLSLSSLIYWLLFHPQNYKLIWILFHSYISLKWIIIIIGIIGFEITTFLKQISKFKFIHIGHLAILMNLKSENKIPDQPTTHSSLQQHTFQTNKLIWLTESPSHTQTGFCHMPTPLNLKPKPVQFQTSRQVRQYCGHITMYCGSMGSILTYISLVNTCCLLNME